MSAKKASDSEIVEYQTQVIMTILHLIGNLRHSGLVALAEVELSYPQVLVLFAVLEKGTTTIGGLSRHLKISQGVISRTVDRLVEKGLLERERDEEDRRVVHVSLSDEGHQFVSRIITYHVDRLGDQFRRISAEERDRFLGMLKEIDRLLEEEGGED